MVKYKVAGHPVKLNKGEKSDGTDWTVTFKNGKTTALANVLALIEPEPELTMKENVDKVVGGIPYRRHGSKVIISEPLDDATKERLIGRAKKHGYFAQPNQAGGITITLKKGMYEELKESTINEVKEMTFGAYLDDLDNRFVDLMKAAKGLNAEGSQEIDMRATINQNFTLFRNYISALKKEYSNELNKELTFSIDETEEVKENIDKVAGGFKKGDKVTYLGHPAIVTATKEYNGRNFVSVSYDKGTGKTKASNVLVTSGDVKAVNEIDSMPKLNEDVSKHTVKHSKSNNTYQVWLGDEIVTDFATKERADAEAKRLNALQNVNEAKKDIYDKFLENPTSPKGRAKAIISKFKKKYGEDATEMAVDRFSKQNNLKPEEKYILKYITKNDIKITSQPGGPNLSVVNEAKATCCHRCGRVHVKGTPCKRPYLKGKDSCAVKEVQDLQERLDSLKETKSAPEGHYFTKSGNLVKGRMTKAAEERGARKSDPKDKMRSKIPKVTQYTEAVKEYMKKHPKVKKSEMMEAVRSIISEHETDPALELIVGDYQTKHYHMCPGAKALYQDIESKGIDMDLAVRTAKLQDALFAMEEEALDNGATEVDLFAAETVASQIMDMARMMGLEEEHSYIQGHITKIKNALIK